MCKGIEFNNMRSKKIESIIYAILAAVFYAISMPLSKLLLEKISPTYMASFLYFGAGIGVGIIYVIRTIRHRDTGEKLSKPDLPYVLGMIILDIAAPILLMIGLKTVTSSNASLLNNFEIAATSLIALFVFKETISKRLWAALLLITISSMLLSIEDISSFTFSYGSIYILSAAICWGLENNFTRKISSKDIYQIVVIKGIFSGLGSLIVALILKQNLPNFQYIAYALILGIVAYGLSIFFYVKAQHELGAAKTSAFYAIAPFIGALLSFIILRESITKFYILALSIMIAGSVLVVIDTLIASNIQIHNRSYNK
ncbi:MAG: EamA-like transporter family protein [Firmicutes bacterium ADurb.Bin146]|nr:MAG: EamA-like transporter family protein [Firmicutes bacterium ADurb.Bin146]